ncbi:MAG TPA: RdgB/HAM1 family non-canonical purine NTP pyrophosphatase [Candidatus Acidoferrales bacterium]
MGEPAFSRLLLASSNSGKLREYQQLAAGSGIEIELVPNFRSLPAFDESAPTFAENAAGKALHYSRLVDGIVLADDSGLVVPALGGAPGIHSARYAGPEATDAGRIEKLLCAMEGKEGNERRARFVCVTAIAERGRALAVVSDFVEGLIAEEPRGSSGFGYDPVFQMLDTNRTYGELPAEEKNRLSHRGRSFGRLAAIFPRQ